MDYLQLGTEPISEEQPAGADVRYEPSFEKLQAEIDKLSSPTERDSFSWSDVTEMASAILKDESKDILAASYLCVGLLYLNGSDGLDQATRIYDELLSRFWETLFPPKKRMRGRAAAIAWWIEKTEAALENGIELRLENTVYESILERLNRIDSLLLSEESLGLSSISLTGRIKTIGPMASKDEKPADHTPGQPEITAPDTQDVEITTAEEAGKKMGPLFQKIRQVSKVFRDEKTKDPRSYRWLRFALWEPVTALPATVNGQTRIPPPAPQLVSRLESLENDEEWSELLVTAESALNNPKNMFLLDLNRYSAVALESLGEKFRQAREAVCHETLLFIRRLGGIEDLVFADGTPFASGETKNWITTLMVSEQDAHNSEKNEADGNDDRISAILNNARISSKDGNLKDGIRSLQQAINNASSGKERLKLRIGLVKLLTSEKQEKAVLPHVDIIFDDIRRHSLNLWEPQLAISGLKTVYTVFKKQSDGRYSQKAVDAFDMIAGIDTVEALKL